MNTIDSFSNIIYNLSKIILDNNIQLIKDSSFIDEIVFKDYKLRHCNNDNLKEVLIKSIHQSCDNKILFDSKLLTYKHIQNKYDCTKLLSITECANPEKISSIKTDRYCNLINLICELRPKLNKEQSLAISNIRYNYTRMYNDLKSVGYKFEKDKSILTEKSILYHNNILTISKQFNIRISYISNNLRDSCLDYKNIIRNDKNDFIKFWLNNINITKIINI
jgi:hypothetical protein